LFGIAFASLMLGFLLAATLKCVFNFFPIRVVPIRVRRTVGLLAGPSIIAGLLWWAASQGHVIHVAAFADNSAPFALAAVITGWLGWRIAPDGASKVWAGGMKWREVPGLIFDLTIGMLLSGITSSVVSVGGSGSGGSGGFSGGGGSSGGGGASGSW
jgi:uncharacterized protein